MKPILMLFLSSILSFSAIGQSICRSVVGSSGDITTTSSTRLQFTVGEAVVNFLSVSGTQISEGYQQDDSVCLMGINEITGIANIDVALSPNPANQTVRVHFSIPYACKVHYQIFDC